MTRLRQAKMPEYVLTRTTRPGPRARAASPRVSEADKRPRYFISIAADIVAVHPRTLRIYENEGLLQPHRRNRLRLYSEFDLEKVRLIRLLTRQHGVNLAGVRIILQLHERGQIDVRRLSPTLGHEQSASPETPTAEQSKNQGVTL